MVHKIPTAHFDESLYGYTYILVSYYIVYYLYATLTCSLSLKFVHRPTFPLTCCPTAASLSWLTSHTAGNPAISWWLPALTTPCTKRRSLPSYPVWPAQPTRWRSKVWRPLIFWLHLLSSNCCSTFWMDWLASCPGSQSRRPPVSPLPPACCGVYTQLVVLTNCTTTLVVFHSSPRDLSSSCILVHWPKNGV